MATVEAWLLGSGGWMPSDTRETACLLIRDGDRALMIDAGTGARRLVTEKWLLDGLVDLDVVLTHFHLDHVCGIAYLRALDQHVSIWGPGAWLYDVETATILASICRPPLSPTDTRSVYSFGELRPGDQLIAGFAVRAGAQLRHWTPTAGIRVDDELALLTDTPYEPANVPLARGVRRLLHEAWSSSGAPIYPEHDATAAEAARLAREADVGELTLVHINPTLDDLSPLVDDATRIFERTTLGQDLTVLR
jgi:ribonuclease BN (tRNA processing enzyme)